ncbi:MAG: ORF6N domain-containing protein, partial [Verrucomicrobia bacterium]|nr:ORF6N domain-containing protein [Verrucomicrobiota bacterium]
MPGTLPVEFLIRVVRQRRIMLDSDLARIYGVKTKVLNQALKRNLERFPIDFAFQFTADELKFLRSQLVTSKRGRGGRRYLPWAFTERGTVMLASVLNSPAAIRASVRVVRAFVLMREQLADHKELAHKLEELERHVSGHDEAIQRLFEAIREIVELPLPET